MLKLNCSPFKLIYRLVANGYSESIHELQLLPLHKVVLSLPGFVHVQTEASP